MATKRQSAEVIKRRRVVRRLLTRCVPSGEIVRLLVDGLEDEDSGQVFQVSESTARRDLEAVEAEFRDLFSEADAADLEIALAFEAYKAIVAEARTGKRPNYHAAISALDRVVKIAASRSATWNHLAGSGKGRGPVGELPPLTDEDQDELVARARELSSMEDGDLVEHHRALRERVDALGLQVLEGAKAGGG